MFETSILHSWNDFYLIGVHWVYLIQQCLLINVYAVFECFSWFCFTIPSPIKKTSIVVGTVFILIQWNSLSTSWNNSGANKSVRSCNWNYCAKVTFKSKLVQGFFLCISPIVLAEITCWWNEIPTNFCNCIPKCSKWLFWCLGSVRCHFLLYRYR